MFAIIRKVYTSGRIRQLFQNHLVLFSTFFLLIQPKSRKSLELLQLSIDQKVLKKLRRRNRKAITFFKNHVSEFEEYHEEHTDVIWVFWLQGQKDAPALVKRCLDYLQKHLPVGKRLIFLTKENYKTYTNLPDYILEKYAAGKISHAHFSDLIRIDLLARHGGTWMDATVLLTSPVNHSYIFHSELFLFQDLRPSTMGHSRRISSWFITAKPNHPIILLARYLLFNYWLKKNSLIEYFLFHSFFELAIEAFPEEWSKVIPVSNATPHILQFKLFEEFDQVQWEHLIEQIEVHKLTYKYSNQDTKGTYLEKILINPIL